MSDPINLTNADFTFKDKNGNTGSNKGITDLDKTKLNNMVKLLNLLLNTPNSTDFINTLATKQYVDDAVPTNMMTTDTAQTITGIKTFSSTIQGDISGSAVTSTTQAASDNSTKIATTAYVKSQGYLTAHQSLANYVTLNSAQTITGNKTLNGTTTVKKVIETAYTNTTNTFSTANGSIHTKTVTANFTMALTMDNNETIVIYLINGGNYTVTFPSNLMWIGGEVPSLTQNGTDCLIIQRTANGYMAIANLDLKVQA